MCLQSRWGLLFSPAPNGLRTPSLLLACVLLFVLARRLEMPRTLSLVFGAGLVLALAGGANANEPTKPDNKFKSNYRTYEFPAALPREKKETLKRGSMGHAVLVRGPRFQLFNRDGAAPVEVPPKVETETVRIFHLRPGTYGGYNGAHLGGVATDHTKFTVE
jgi:hypothetical protein